MLSQDRITPLLFSYVGSLHQHTRLTVPGLHSCMLCTLCALQKNKKDHMIIVYGNEEKLAASTATMFVQKGWENVFMLSGGEPGHRRLLAANNHSPHTSLQASRLWRKSSLCWLKARYLTHSRRRLRRVADLVRLMRRAHCLSHITLTHTCSTLRTHSQSHAGGSVISSRASVTTAGGGGGRSPKTMATARLFSDRASVKSWR